MNSLDYTVYQSKSPVIRSKIRIFLGKLYFTWRRYLRWVFNKSIKYATTTNIKTNLPYIVARHSTPLYRNLRNVDMCLQENKVINLRLAAERINGLIIRPGETYSFWYLVGKPSKGKGFREGMVLTNGSFCPGVGGGLCQLSNLIYWIALHTSLTVTERWRHTHDVFPDVDRTQPFGSGATVVYNYVDLQIKNETPYYYQLLVWVEDLNLQGEFRCEKECPFKFEVYQSDHLITHEWWGGYIRHNVIRRKVYDQGNNQIRDDLLTENHAIMMYEPLLSEIN